MKTLTLSILAILALSLSSCKKEEVRSETPETLYLRIEGVRDDGSSVYSPIKPV